LLALIKKTTEFKAMSKSLEIAKKINDEIDLNKSIESIKNTFSNDDNEWFRFSSKAYNLNIEKEKKDRKIKKKNVSRASNQDIERVLNLNNVLSEYALLFPIFSTTGDLNHLEKLIANLPESEFEIIEFIGRINLHPKIRVAQKKGRIEKFDYFKPFSKLVDSATLSYYRKNYIACYLTLIPIIEGVIIRWLGYPDIEEKPDFEKIRKFFKNSAMRQPNPTNILFHKIYVEICDKILNYHFYKPTTTGISYSNFNRHQASHLLNDEEFATKENCIRLYILLDAMTEIYFYESKENDPRFSLSNSEMESEINILANIMLDSENVRNAESLLLRKN